MLRDAVLTILKERGGYVSGAEISRELHVTRMAVSNAVRALRDDVGDRGLARAGRTIENHIRNLAGIDNPAQKPVFSENVRLTAHIVETLRSERVCQRLIHASASF